MTLQRTSCKMPGRRRTCEGAAIEARRSAGRSGVVESVAGAVRANRRARSGASSTTSKTSRTGSGMRRTSARSLRRTSARWARPSSPRRALTPTTNRLASRPAHASSRRSAHDGPRPRARRGRCRRPRARRPRSAGCGASRAHRAERNRTGARARTRPRRASPRPSRDGREAAEGGDDGARPVDDDAAQVPAVAGARRAPAPNHASPPIEPPDRVRERCHSGEQRPVPGELVRVAESSDSKPAAGDDDLTVRGSLRRILERTRLPPGETARPALGTPSSRSTRSPSTRKSPSERQETANATGRSSRMR